MAETIRSNVDGTVIIIETEPGRGVTRSAVGGKVIEQAGDALENASETIKGMAISMVGAIKSLDQSLTPNEFTLQFGLKFNAEGNALVAKFSGEATLNVTMKYIHDQGNVQQS